MIFGNWLWPLRRVAILDQALERLVVFDAPGLDEGVEGRKRILLGLRHPDFLQRPLGFRLLALRQFVEDVGVLCTQERWPRVWGHPSSRACQNPSAPSATASSGPIDSPRRFRSSSSSRQDCALSRTPSLRPTSSFPALGCGSDDDQQALRGVFETGLDVNAVNPEEDVAFGREIALAPAHVLFGSGLLEV
jgi:hypothetical protein